MFWRSLKNPARRADPQPCTTYGCPCRPRAPRSRFARLVDVADIFFFPAASTFTYPAYNSALNDGTSKLARIDLFSVAVQRACVHGRGDHVVPGNAQLGVI